MNEINFTIDFSNLRTIIEIILFIIIVTNLPALILFLKLEYQIYKNGKL